MNDDFTTLKCMLESGDDADVLLGISLFDNMEREIQYEFMDALLANDENWINSTPAQPIKDQIIVWNKKRTISHPHYDWIYVTIGPLIPLIENDKYVRQYYKNI